MCLRKLSTLIVSLALLTSCSYMTTTNDQSSVSPVTNNEMPTETTSVPSFRSHSSISKDAPKTYTLGTPYASSSKKSENESSPPTVSTKVDKPVEILEDPVNLVTENGAVMQSSPDDQARVISPIPSNVTITVQKIKGTEWYKISDSKYVSGKYLSETGKPSITSTNLHNNETGSSSKSSNIQSSASDQNLSKKELEDLKILESYVPGNASISFDISVCRKDNPSSNNCVSSGTPTVIRINGSSIQAKSEDARSLILHEYSHTLQFKWRDRDLNNKKLLETLDYEKMADCMAFQLGAKANKPGGYVTSDQCTPEMIKVSKRIIAETN